MKPYLDTHTAIIGQSGMGKTVTAKGMVERLLDEQRHTCIIDPTSVWWGLRSSATEAGASFDIPIFGGEHGDVAITPQQGEAIGAYVAGGVSAIIDLGAMDSRDQRRFMLDFMRALRKKPRGNFHLVVDEADEYCPQTAPDDVGYALVEQLAWVAKRGRVQGFVLTAITQRPADIAKSVLTQMQTIIAHRLIAPQDQKPIDDYLKGHGDSETRKAVMGSLASLGRGERWVYSPGMGLLERGFSPPAATFDSSRTPEPGEIPTEPHMLASIDIAAIRKALAPVEPVPADPIAAFQAGSEAGAIILERDARIAKLEGELSSIRAGWAMRGERLLAAEKALKRASEEARSVSNFVEATIDRLFDDEEIPAQGGGGPEVDEGQTEERIAIAQAAPRAKPQRQRHEPQGVTAGETAIPASQQRVLDAIAWWRAVGIEPVERNRASVIAGLSPKASTFGVYVSKLAQAGLVETTPGAVKLTETGVASANFPAKIDRGEVVSQATAMLSPAAQAVFRQIVAVYPNWVDRGALADACGLSRTASTLGVYISKASALGFVETKPGKVRAADWMMP